MSTEFHKHCQKTVLSAYGTAGNGATWNVINDLNLANLPSNWKNNFHNSGTKCNITYDFASMLKILNSISPLDRYLPLSGGTMTGRIKFQNLGAIYSVDDSKYIGIFGGTEYANGASLILRGANYTSDLDTVVRKGNFSLHAQGETDSGKTLEGYPSGKLTWGGQSIVRWIKTDATTRKGVNPSDENDGTVDISSEFVHSKGNETIAGNKTFSGNTTLSSSPSSDATGHEVVDAAWVNKKILDLNLYTPPAALSSIRVYMSSNGNDTTALAAFKELISSQDVGEPAQQRLASSPFKTLRACVDALGLVRSSKIGFTFYIFALPGTYTMSTSTSDTTANVNGTTTLRHSDCNEYSGSKIILRGAHSATNTKATRGEVKFTFKDVNEARSGTFGYDFTYISLVNASVQNICFCQQGITFDASGNVIYTKPCEASEITSGSTNIISSGRGSNEIINCECYCKPVKDRNNTWRAYNYITILNKSSIDIYSTDDYYRHEEYDKDGNKTGNIVGHRCCFYGLNNIHMVSNGQVLTSWRTFDFYFNNCKTIYNVGDANEYGASVTHWVNHSGDTKTYQAWELDNVYRMFVMDNEARIVIRDDSNVKYDDLYNPLEPGYLKAIVVKNTPKDANNNDLFALSNIPTFNSKVSSAILYSVTDRSDFNKLIKFQSYYHKI